MVRTHVRSAMSSQRQISRELSTLPWLDLESAQQTVQEFGAPRFRSEPWKYTNPNPFVDFLNAGEFESPRPPSASHESVEILAFSDPAATWAAKSFGTIAGNNSSTLTAFNLLNLSSGFVVQAQPAGGEVPVLTIESAPNSCERFLVVVRAGAQLEIVEKTAGGNRVIECLIEQGATLVHKRLQQPATLADYSHVVTRLNDNATYRFSQSSTGSSLRRNEIVVEIQGQGVNANLEGGWRLHDQTHLDSQVTVNHLTPGSESRLKFHGVVGGKSRAVFNGRIHIARDAQGTNAHLDNKNILTSNEAEVYAKPELEIYADDVKCSHGATSGQLDGNQIFYLLTRGIERTHARNLLLGGFLREVVSDESGARLLGVAN